MITMTSSGGFLYRGDAAESLATEVENATEETVPQQFQPLIATSSGYDPRSGRSDSALN